MVKWTDHAKFQLRHIHDYIAQDSTIYARRVTEDLVKKTIGLDELPRKGKKYKIASYISPTYKFNFLQLIVFNNITRNTSPIQHGCRAYSPG